MILFIFQECNSIISVVKNERNKQFVRFWYPILHWLDMVNIHVDNYKPFRRPNQLHKYMRFSKPEANGPQLPLYALKLDHKFLLSNFPIHGRHFCSLPKLPIESNLFRRIIFNRNWRLFHQLFGHLPHSHRYNSIRTNFKNFKKQEMAWENLAYVDYGVLVLVFIDLLRPTGVCLRHLHVAKLIIWYDSIILCGF